MIDFIEESREALGVEPICKALQFAPSTYYERRAIARDPERASLRAKSDAALSLKIEGAWADNRKLLWLPLMVQELSYLLRMRSIANFCQAFQRSHFRSCWPVW